MTESRDTTFDAPWHNNSWQVWQTDDLAWAGRPVGANDFTIYNSWLDLIDAIEQHRREHREAREAAREVARDTINRVEANERTRSEAAAFLSDLGL